MRELVWNWIFNKSQNDESSSNVSLKYTVGPMVGGVLYSVGGYFLPFVTLGLLLFSTACITLCILPKHNDTVQQDHPSGKFIWNLIFWYWNDNLFEIKTHFVYELLASMTTLLKIPGILVCALSIMATSASIGFLGALLEPHLRQFDLSPVLLGKIYMKLYAFKL